MIKEKDVLKQALEVEKELKEEVSRSKSPLWYILGILLALLIIIMIIPHYSVRLDPEPSKIPAINEVVRLIDINESVFDRITLDMIDGSDPFVKEVADRIASLSCESNKVCHAKAMFYFVRDNFDYVSDPNAVEYVKSAKMSLFVSAIDCDDGAVLLSNLMDAIGIRWRFVFIPGHVYVEILLPEALNRYKQENEWIPLDVTCKNCEFGELPYQNADKPKT